jgi:type IV pilus assembly protein PilO
MNINLKDTNTQLLVLIGLTLAAGFVFYLYVIQPVYAETEGMKQEVAKLQTQIEQFRAMERKLPQYKRELTILQNRLNELKIVLPDEKETTEIIRQVQQFAISSQVRLKAFRPQKMVPKDVYDEWPIQMEFEGFYNSLGAFFDKVAKHSRILNVSNLNIKRIPNSEEVRKTLTASCTTTTFVLK